MDRRPRSQKIRLFCSLLRYQNTSFRARNPASYAGYMNFANVKVVGFESNYHDLLFLEAWHSTLDPNASNDHIVLPEAYKDLTRA